MLLCEYLFIVGIDDNYVVLVDKHVLKKLVSRVDAVRLSIPISIFKLKLVTFLLLFYSLKYIKKLGDLYE